MCRSHFQPPKIPPAKLHLHQKHGSMPEVLIYYIYTIWGRILSQAARLDVAYHLFDKKCNLLDPYEFPINKPKWLQFPRFVSHRTHGHGIFTCIYLQIQPFMWVNMPNFSMDPMGLKQRERSSTSSPKKVAAFVGTYLELTQPMEHKKLACPLKRDHFKRKIHLPTINFQGIC